jgi:hypothetical protein
VLDSHPDTRVVAVGPEPAGRWTDAAEQWGAGRVRALGPLTDAAIVLDAADVYLDSFPFCSITSLLDTGMHGCPALAFQPSELRDTVLVTNAPGVERGLRRAATPEEYTRVLRELVDDTTARSRAGDELGADLRSAHGGDAWRERLEAVYERASTAHAEPGPVGGAPCARADGLDAAVRTATSGLRVTLPNLAAHQLTEYACVDRARTGGAPEVFNVITATVEAATRALRARTERLARDADESAVLAAAQAARAAAAEDELRSMQQSSSWRFTAPLRALRRRARRS